MEEDLKVAFSRMIAAAEDCGATTPPNRPMEGFSIEALKPLLDDVLELKIADTSELKTRVRQVLRSLPSLPNDEAADYEHLRVQTRVAALKLALHEIDDLLLEVPARTSKLDFIYVERDELSEIRDDLSEVTNLLNTMKVEQDKLVARDKKRTGISVTAGLISADVDVLIDKTKVALALMKERAPANLGKVRGMLQDISDRALKLVDEVKASAYVLSNNIVSIAQRVSVKALSALAGGLRLSEKKLQAADELGRDDHIWPIPNDGTVVWIRLMEQLGKTVELNRVPVGAEISFHEALRRADLLSAAEASAIEALRVMVDQTVRSKGTFKERRDLQPGIMEACKLIIERLSRENKRCR